jgi:hypothetical protein
MSEKPVVRSGIVTEFGLLEDDPATLLDETGMARDITYVPGFSDMRRAADFARSERGNKNPQPLPVNLRWARRTRANGTPTNERTVAHQRTGYEPVTKEDLGQPWLTHLPAGASILPDGTVATADMQLMKCSQKTAQRNEARKQLRWMELQTASQEEAIKKASTQVKGSTAEVTKELGPAISS